MRNRLPTFIFIAMTLCRSLIASAQFTYISPMPGSIYHNPETNIILKATDKVDATLLVPQAVSISGSLSGSHACNIILSDDQKTILIYPAHPFSENETVAVSTDDHFKKWNGDAITGTSF